MDVNGTRFHLLLGGRDWRPRLDAAGVPPDERLEWDPRAGQVMLRPDMFRFPPRSAEQPLTHANRRGSARDRFGHFYWIDVERRAIRYRPRDDSASSRFWSVENLTGEKAPPPASGAFVDCAPPPPASLPILSGLAVTDRHFLVAGTLAPSGLLVFDLHGGGPPVWMRWPESVPFEPFDLSPVPGGGLWILDRPSGASARLWRLDGDLRVVRAADDVEIAAPPLPDAFHPVIPVTEPDCVAAPRTFPSGIDLGFASPALPATGEALAVVTLPDCTAVVMEVDAAAGDTRLYRWTLTEWQGGSPSVWAAPLGAPASLALALSMLVAAPVALVGHDMAFVPASADAPPGVIAGTLFVADVAGNQSFEFSLTTGIRGTTESAMLDVQALRSYYPMRRWAGKALVAGDDGEVYYDLSDAWLPLTDLPRPRYARRGVLDGVVFDGKEPGCVWHRLLLDGCIPPGDAVEIETRTADDLDELVLASFRREPELRLRPAGSELAWVHDLRNSGPHAPGAGTWELLFQAAVGRFIEIRLSFRGSGRSSPKIHALRAYYPRFSYLSYLPDVYREDRTSASFLDRFLANFEGLLTELEGRVANAEVLFDWRTAPPETLDWLASWLGAVLDSNWETSRRRLFLQHAAELYRRRGTRRGLLAAVRLSVDECPTGANLFADEGDGGPFGFRASEAFSRGAAGSAHRVTVLAPVGLSSSPIERHRLRDSVTAVVERERPAHAAFDVQLYWALFRVGAARVGHDTALGEGSRFSALVLDAGYLGESLLAERHPWEVTDRRVEGRDRTGFAPPLS